MGLLFHNHQSSILGHLRVTVGFNDSVALGYISYIFYLRLAGPLKGFLHLVDLKSVHNSFFRVLKFG